MSVAASTVKDTNEFALLRESLSLLRADDAAILQRLVLLLRRVSEKSSINRMGPRNLAIVFAPNLMRALDPASAVVESELEIDAIEICIRCCDQLYREPYVPVSVAASSSSSSSADAAAADDGSTDPLAAFPCRWMKRNGKVEIFESSFVHASNKLLKSKRARVFLNDIVEISANADAKSLSSASLASNTMGRSSTDAASSSVAATSSGTMRSASVGGASAVPPPLGSLRNMSSLLHEVRSRAGVVGKFVLRLTLRQGAVVTTVVTIGSQRDINREVGDFVLLVFDSQVSMKEAAALLERLRREPWRTALSPRRVRARASQHQLNDDAAHSSSNRTSDGDGGESKSTLNTLRVPSSERVQPLSLSVDALSNNSTSTSSQSPPSSPTTGARTTPPATTWLDVRSRSPPARRPKHPAPMPTRVESTPLIKSTSPRDSGSAKDNTTKRAATLTKHSATSTSSTDLHAAPAPPARRKKKRGSNSAKADDIVASDDSSSSN